MEATKNQLRIRLTESAVFLGSNPVIVRGLLSLVLVRPTRICSIELDLSCLSSASWPQGIGANRSQVNEEHELYSAHSLVFKADDHPPRRTSSLGPTDDWEDISQTPRNGLVSDVAGTETPISSPRLSRRVSADDFQFMSSHEPLPETPPYSPYESTSVSRAPSQLRPENPAQTLEDLRNVLLASMTPENNSPTIPHFPFPPSPPITSSSSGFTSRRDRTRSVERPRSSLTPSRNVSPPPDSPPADERGRKRHNRFSLNKLLTAVKDRVSHDNELDPHQERTPSRDRDPSKRRARFSLSSHEPKETEGDGWKEFKKGVYTYPISFPIPPHSPPTLAVPSGNISWTLKALVRYRPSPTPSFLLPLPLLKSHAKLSTHRPILVVASPTDDRDGDSAGRRTLTVERRWDDQLQYLIQIGGRGSFYVGGVIPLTLVLMPLAKVAVHRLSVYIEERIDYYTQMARIASTDPVRRIPLLAIKPDPKTPHVPILPFVPSSTGETPFAAFLPAHENEDESAKSEFLSHLMGPGPYTLSTDLVLPTTHTELHFTYPSSSTRHAHAARDDDGNTHAPATPPPIISISHTLKIVLRVERGDDRFLDPKNPAKRKQFDIVVGLKIEILSCRWNPEWSALPRYEVGAFRGANRERGGVDDGAGATGRTVRLVQPPLSVSRCPCTVFPHEPHSRPASASASSAETSPVIPGPSLRFLSSGIGSNEIANGGGEGGEEEDTLLVRNVLFERLVAGLESEVGEAPPAYAG